MKQRKVPRKEEKTPEKEKYKYLKFKLKESDTQGDFDQKINTWPVSTEEMKLCAVVF